MHHVLVLPYPSQGHVNPMHELCKRLVSKGIKSTFLLTNFISNSTTFDSSGAIPIDTISDGYDQGGFSQAKDIDTYLQNLRQSGSKTLAKLIHNYMSSPHPVDCIIYDSLLPWALDVAKEFGLLGASFFTQPCTVNYIYYLAHHGKLTLPVPSLPVSIPGMPLLRLEDLPSYIYVHGSYPAYFKLVLNQFLNIDKADYVFVNTFYKLEEEVIDEMSKRVSHLMMIGPMIPSFYLGGDQLEDVDYAFHLHNLNDSPAVCEKWLSSKPAGSVVYVSFGSMAGLGADQMEELAMGLRAIASDYYYLWVVRASEEGKLCEEMIDSSKGLVVQWSPQLQVLSSESVGCFFSHAGWNSTLEALSLGVAMVVMPQWTDQPTNAKLVEDVWKVGVRVKVEAESGMVGRKEIERCVREVMGGEGGKEMKKNAGKWRDLAKEAAKEGGASDKNIQQFVSQLTTGLF